MPGNVLIALHCQQTNSAAAQFATEDTPTPKVLYSQFQ